MYRSLSRIAELLDEDLRIGYPVLKHLRVDSRTFLEQCRAILDGADCPAVQNKGTSDESAIGRLMLARNDGIFTKEMGTNATRSNLQTEDKKTGLESTTTIFWTRS